MPTKRPRLNITLDESTMDALTRLSEASGIAKSSWVAQVVNESTPVWVQLAEAFEASRGAPGRALGIMSDALQGVMVDAAQVKLALDEKPKPRLRKKRS